MERDESSSRSSRRAAADRMAHQRGSSTLQTLMLVVGLGLGGAAGVGALRNLMAEKSQCVGEAITNIGGLGGCTEGGGNGAIPLPGGALAGLELPPDSPFRGIRAPIDGPGFAERSRREAAQRKVAKLEIKDVLKAGKKGLKDILKNVNVTINVDTDDDDDDKKGGDDGEEGGDGKKGDNGDEKDKKTRENAFFEKTFGGSDSFEAFGRNITPSVTFSLEKGLGNGIGFDGTFERVDAEDGGKKTKVGVGVSGGIFGFGARIGLDAVFDKPSKGDGGGGKTPGDAPPGEPPPPPPPKPTPPPKRDDSSTTNDERDSRENGTGKTDDAKSGDRSDKDHSGADHDAPGDQPGDGPE